MPGSRKGAKATATFTLADENGVVRNVTAREWADAMRFNAKRRGIFNDPLLSKERGQAIVEKFRNMTEAEASFELYKLEERGTKRELAAAMIGLTQRTKNRQIAQDKREEGDAFMMDEAILIFEREYKSGTTKTAAARKAAASHGVSYKTVLRRAESRGLV